MKLDMKYDHFKTKSRRSNLMDKKLEYTSLYDLVMDFEQAYRNCGHRLVKCRIGNLISHDMYSIAPIPWKGITMHLRTEDPTEVKIKVDKFSRELRSFLRMK